MSDLKTVLINDSRIEDISGDLTFAVQGGPQQSLFQSTSFNTSTNSSHSVDIQVGSENLVVDRRLLLDMDVEFNITISNVASGSLAWNYGVTDSFGPYPLNSCYINQQVKMNSSTVSVQTQDVMAALLRMNPQSIHTNYDGWTPSMVDDVYYNYSDGIGSINNPLGSITNSSFDNKIRGRGCHPLKTITVTHTLSTGGTDTSLLSTNIGDSWVINITTHFTEPFLFLSPFLSNPENNNQAGFLGINAFSLNFTLDSNLRRVFRTSNDYTISYALGTSTSGSGFSNAKVLVNYLSVQPSQYAKISARNILPVIRYQCNKPNGSSTTALAALSTGTYSSSNITYNSIPDTFIIFGRVPINQQTAKDSDSFFTIKSISISFNNVGGILSTCTQQELWAISQKCGSTQSWNEFSGQVNTVSADGKGSTIPSIGSLLVVNPVTCFNLPDYLSCSSLGSFSFQFTITFENFSDTSYSPEIVVITPQSGYLVLSQGSSQGYEGILNKEMVMASKEGASVPRLSQSDYERLVGGARENRGTTNMMKYMKGKMGGVMSGGMMSGPSSSGRLGKYIK